MFQHKYNKLYSRFLSLLKASRHQDYGWGDCNIYILHQYASNSLWGTPKCSLSTKSWVYPVVRATMYALKTSLRGGVPDYMPEQLSLLWSSSHTLCTYFRSGMKALCMFELPLFVRLSPTIPLEEPHLCHDRLPWSFLSDRQCSKLGVLPHGFASSSPQPSSPPPALPQLLGTTCSVCSCELDPVTLDLSGLSQ